MLFAGQLFTIFETSYLLSQKVGSFSFHSFVVCRFWTFFKDNNRKTLVLDLKVAFFSWSRIAFSKRQERFESDNNLSFIISGCCTVSQSVQNDIASSTILQNITFKQSFTQNDTKASKKVEITYKMLSLLLFSCMYNFGRHLTAVLPDICKQTL